MLSRNRQSSAQLAAMHQHHLRRRLQWRIEVAQLQGNRALLRQLEAERQFLK
jgi:hypothetical protein